MCCEKSMNRVYLLFLLAAQSWGAAYAWGFSSRTFLWRPDPGHRPGRYAGRSSRPRAERQSPQPTVHIVSGAQPQRRKSKWLVLTTALALPEGARPQGLGLSSVPAFREHAQASSQDEELGNARVNYENPPSEVEPP
jgi:hypothetical protein